ncbi:MAG: shikimate dehydrogenase, partial [Actinomycetota bacterium]|nr:shikimate dehydrogenase [Actinomycetota bacterium]
SLAEAGAQVGIVNRSADRARLVADGFGPDVSVAVAADVAGADLVVQATPLGMRPDDAVPIDPELLAPGQLLVDLVYHPKETVLLEAARRRGVEAINGVGMLLYQAGEQFELWTGETAPIEVMAAAVDLVI